MPFSGESCRPSAGVKLPGHPARPTTRAPGPGLGRWGGVGCQAAAPRRLGRQPAGGSRQRLGRCPPCWAATPPARGLPASACMHRQIQLSWALGCSGVLRAQARGLQRRLGPSSGARLRPGAVRVAAARGGGPLHAVRAPIHGAVLDGVHREVVKGHVGAGLLGGLHVVLGMRPQQGEQLAHVHAPQQAGARGPAGGQVVRKLPRPAWARLAAPRLVGATRWNSTSGAQAGRRVRRAAGRTAQLWQRPDADRQRLGAALLPPAAGVRAHL